MKKIYTLFLALIITGSLMAQTPQSFKYQAVARDASGGVVADQAVGMQISILQGSTSGTAVYVETFTLTTNGFGLINLDIGAGTVVSGDFTTIDWSADTYFIKVEMDLSGGTSYEEYGTSQLLSVPYALHAKTVDNSDDADPDPINEIQNLSDVLTEGSDAGNNEIGNVSKIGIGTSDPGAQLHLESIQDVEIFLEADNNNITESDNPIIKMSQDNGLTVGGWGFDANNEMFLTSYSTAKHGFYISTDSIVRLAIDSSGIIDVKNNNITNLAEPVNDQDAATKVYVDALENQVSIMNDIMSIMNDNMLDLGYNGTIMDVEGNLYKTIKIGDQIWMAENLKTTKYNDGTAIPLVTDNTEWFNLTTGAYCWYNNNEATYKNTYGALYIWYTVNTGNLCPTGWHVPTDTEWTTLTDYLGGTSIAGGKLKETGTTHWTTPNTGATNETGFTALPGGNRMGSGTFSNLGIYGFWWSPTEYNASSARTRSLFYNSSSVARDAYSKKTGFSVRCLRD